MHIKAFYLLAVITGFSAHAPEIKRLDYEGFYRLGGLWQVRCVKFQYNAKN